jgi:peptidoglycan/xylan/chitin deacetylase (PgdA/CDA1 family)
VALRRAGLVAALLLAAGPAGATPQYFELERIPTQRRLVALTFDGGGATATGTRLILATLTRGDVTATFFVSGHWITLHRALARQIGRHFPVGNHTYAHQDMRGLSDAALRAEVRRGAYMIRRVAHRDPRPLFRFPYGARDARTVAVVNALGYTSVRWSLDTWGWMGPPEGQSKATVVHRVSTMLSPGDIVLLHIGANRDGSTLDADALPAILRLLERRGYRTVTLGRYVTAPR